MRWTRNGARIRIIIFVLVLSASVLIYLNLHTREKTQLSTNGPAGSLASSGLYTSRLDKFSVNFHGEPAIQTRVIILKRGNPDVTTRVRFYSKLYNRALYSVTAIKLPANYSNANTDENLRAALDGNITDPNNMKLLSSNYSEFKGMRSIDGNFTITTNDNTRSLYAKYFIRESMLYSLQTVSAPQSQIDAFLQSFE